MQGGRDTAVPTEGACYGAITFEAPKEATVLRWTLAFFIVAIVAAVFGFGGIAAGAASIARILFFVFVVLFVLSLLSRLFR